MADQPRVHSNTAYLDLDNPGFSLFPPGLTLSLCVWLSAEVLTHASLLKADINLMK